MLGAIPDSVRVRNLSNLKDYTVYKAHVVLCREEEVGTKLSGAVTPPVFLTEVYDLPEDLRD